MRVSESVKKIREKLNMSQREFAEALSMSQTAVSQYELGQKQPSLKVISKIIKFAKEKKIKIKLEDIFPDE